MLLKEGGGEQAGPQDYGGAGDYPTTPVPPDYPITPIPPEYPVTPVDLYNPPLNAAPPLSFTDIPSVKTATIPKPPTTASPSVSKAGDTFRSAATKAPERVPVMSSPFDIGKTNMMPRFDADGNLTDVVMNYTTDVGTLSLPGGMAEPSLAVTSINTTNHFVSTTHPIVSITGNSATSVAEVTGKAVKLGSEIAKGPPTMDTSFEPVTLKQGFHLEGVKGLGGKPLNSPGVSYSSLTGADKVSLLPDTFPDTFGQPLNSGVPLNSVTGSGYNLAHVSVPASSPGFFSKLGSSLVSSMRNQGSFSALSNRFIAYAGTQGAADIAVATKMKKKQAQYFVSFAGNILTASPAFLSDTLINSVPKGLVVLAGTAAAKSAIENNISNPYVSSFASVAGGLATQHVLTGAFGGYEGKVIEIRAMSKEQVHKMGGPDKVPLAKNRRLVELSDGNYAVKIYDGSALPSGITGALKGLAYGVKRDWIPVVSYGVYTGIGELARHSGMKPELATFASSVVSGVTRDVLVAKFVGSDRGFLDLQEARLLDYERKDRKSDQPRLASELESVKVLTSEETHEAFKTLTDRQYLSPDERDEDKYYLLTYKESTPLDKLYGYDEYGYGEVAPEVTPNRTWGDIALKSIGGNLTYATIDYGKNKIIKRDKDTGLVKNEFAPLIAIAASSVAKGTVGRIFRDEKIDDKKSGLSDGMKNIGIKDIPLVVVTDMSNALMDFAMDGSSAITVDGERGERYEVKGAGPFKEYAEHTKAHRRASRAKRAVALGGPHGSPEGFFLATYDDFVDSLTNAAADNVYTSIAATPVADFASDKLKIDMDRAHIVKVTGDFRNKSFMPTRTLDLFERSKDRGGKVTYYSAGANDTTGQSINFIYDKNKDKYITQIRTPVSRQAFRKELAKNNELDLTSPEAINLKVGFIEEIGKHTDVAQMDEFYLTTEYDKDMEFAGKGYEMRGRRQEQGLPVSLSKNLTVGVKDPRDIGYDVITSTATDTVWTMRYRLSEKESIKSLDHPNVKREKLRLPPTQMTETGFEDYKSTTTKKIKPEELVEDMISPKGKKFFFDPKSKPPDGKRDKFILSPLGGKLGPT